MSRSKSTFSVSEGSYSRLISSSETVWKEVFRSGLGEGKELGLLALVSCSFDCPAEACSVSGIGSNKRLCGAEFVKTGY